MVDAIPTVNCCDHANRECCLEGASLEAIELLWNSDMLASKSLSNGPVENAAIFLNDLGRVAGAGFKPTTEDMLCVRLKTEAAGCMRFKMKGQDMAIWDVAGQKLERFKYNAGEDNDITSLVFVASLTDFEGGLVLAEDKKTDRIDDTLRLFDLMCNRFFPDSPVILLLNKFDKFEKNCLAGKYADSSTFQKVPAKDRNNPKILIEAIEDQFQARAPKQVSKEMFRSFETTAIDERNMTKILERMEGIIITGKVADFFGE